MTSTLKRPPASEPRINCELFTNQELGVRAAFGRTDLDDHDVFHDTNLSTNASDKSEPFQTFEEKVGGYSSRSRRTACMTDTGVARPASPARIEIVWSRVSLG